MVTPPAAGSGAGFTTRLPLQVGTTANYSIARSAIPLFIGIGIVVTLTPDLWNKLTSRGGGDFATVASGLVFLAAGVMCLVYGFGHVRAAIARRASDLILGPSGLRIEGGPRSGQQIPWNELSPPFATVEQGAEAQFKFFRILGWAVTLSLRLALPIPVLSPRSSTTVWSLRVFRRGETLLVSKTDQDVEAQSMEAAASSIVAIEEGRQHVARAPKIRVRIVPCPDCGAPAVPRDADHVTCEYCGAQVLLSGEVRGQAAAVEAIREARAGSVRIVERLIRQPRAAATNAWLVPLWAVSLVSPFLGYALVAAYVDLGLDTTVGGVSRWYLLALSPAVVLSTYVLGRARLVNRVAMQLLTLGYGALAPARDGDPSRCRWCEAPLPGGTVGGLTQCRYCGTDNIHGIDLRPFTNQARAQKECVDDVLRERASSIWRWGLAAFFAVLLLAGTLAAGVPATQIALEHEDNRHRACLSGQIDDCTWLFERHVSRESPDRVRASFYDQACSAGHTDACYLLACEYEAGAALTRADASAAAYYAKGCDGGHAAACNDLAILYQDGRGVPQDRPKARELYQKACHLGNMPACHNLAYEYANAAGERNGEVRAVRLYERACSGGVTDSCVNLSLIYFNRAEKEDSRLHALGHLQRGAKYAKQACAAESELGCNNLQVIRARIGELRETEGPPATPGATSP